MYKSDADEIAQSMRALLEKRAGVWDWMKNQFGFEGFKKLDYNQFIQAIDSAQTCKKVPNIKQWDRTGAPQNMRYEVDLVINLLNRRIANKIKQLQEAGKCQ